MYPDIGLDANLFQFRRMIYLVHSHFLFFSFHFVLLLSFFIYLFVNQYLQDINGRTKENEEHSLIPLRDHVSLTLSSRRIGIHLDQTTFRYELPLLYIHVSYFLLFHFLEHSICDLLHRWELFKSISGCIS